MRSEERNIMAAVIAGGVCAGSTGAAHRNPVDVAKQALAVADAIIAQTDAEETARDEAAVAAARGK